ncbi:MAG: PqiC family protein, partial [Caulobacteraceae bacterium]
MRRIAVIAGLLALCACSHSPPTRFFTLSPVGPEGGAASAPSGPIQLDSVHIPAELDRPQMVRQASPNRLEIKEQDRWGAPLGAMMRRTLAQDLLARLPAGDFILPDAPRAVGVRGLVVNILELQASDGRVILQASWSLIEEGDARPAFTHNIELSAKAGGGPAGEASAISKVLGSLAD